MSDALKILLDMEPAEAEEKEFEVKRLSQQAGKPVVFRQRGIGYNRAAEIREKSEGQDVQILLAGTASPNWKDTALQEKYGAATPAEVVKKVLRPGEIADLSREVERLSGYLTRTIAEVKKN